jgi:hypothetical protein
MSRRLAAGFRGCVEDARYEWERGCRLWGAFAGYGSKYGAALGALWGTIHLLRFGESEALLLGPVFGAMMGAFGGSVAGLVGNVIGGLPGWFIGGVLGSAGPAVGVYYLSLGVGQPALRGSTLLVAPACVILGGVLGLALGMGLRRGKSKVPGVEALAAIIAEDKVPERAARPAQLPTEVSPSAAPGGRGDEAAPAHPVSSQ